MADYQLFALGDFLLESGMLLRDAKLAYKTHGQLNARKDNAILLCSWYTGTHAGYEFLIQPERCFDPSKYFVILCQPVRERFILVPRQHAQAVRRVAFPNRHHS